ncbi:MAG: LysR family transcriptional regulator [Halioglobus sp.]|nr:LysR family transcriptional regulator [Halioglobus sp.]
MSAKLNLKGVDLNLLTVFEAVMETGQLSQAGVQLGLTQPAMSAALQRLRLTLKDPLFVRSRRGMEPTPRAQAWYLELAPALAQIRQSLAPRQVDPAHSERHFTMVTGDYFETVHLAALLERLQAEAPRVGVDLLPLFAEGVPSDFKLGQNDFAIYFQPPAGRGVDYQVVGKEELVVICRKDHPRIKKRVSLKQFNQEKHVLISTANQQRTVIDELLSEHTVERRLLAKVSHFSSAAMVLENTDALCTVPAGMGEFLESRFAVKCCQFPLQLPPIDKLLIWPTVLADDPLHGWFRTLLIEIITNQAASRPRR